MKESKPKKSWLGLGAVGLFLLSKMKWLFVVLKLAKFGSLISIFVSLGAYALVYGWKFAGVIVYLIYVHEMGHLLAAKRKGVKTSKAIFIPFLGAFISMKEQPKDANTEAYLAYGGPLLGTIAFLPAIPLFIMTENPFWLMVITLGALLNLFNLMPVYPLDGGRIVGVISTKIWTLGIIGMILYLFFHPNPLLILFLLFGIGKWWSDLRGEMNVFKRQVVIDANRFAMEEFEKFTAAPFDERIGFINKWNAEADYKKRKLYKMNGWFIPVLEDKKKKEKYKTEVEIRTYSMLLDHILTIDTEPKELVLALFENEIKTQEEQLQSERTYYVSEGKTKIIWGILYVGLAIFLIATSMYAGDLMDKYRSLLP
nr:site-2 protease family protein [Mesobacillus foraminis]